MLELHTLGPVGIRTSDGSVSAATIVQPKRLALLVYLAMAPRRRCRRRDQAVALFWPEQDPAGARGALSQALHYLRKSLGEAVLVTQGEEEIGVDQTRLRCDAAAFELAVAEGNHEAAAATYRGPFLDGFFVADASQQWEEWVAGERSRLRDLALQAFRAGSARAAAAGNHGEAIRWARRGIVASPDAEPPVADLIRTLIESGDRAGALREYHRHRERLRAEFGIEPSPAVEAMVKTIQRS